MQGVPFISILQLASVLTDVFSNAENNHELLGTWENEHGYQKSIANWNSVSQVVKVCANNNVDKYVKHIDAYVSLAAPIAENKTTCSDSRSELGSLICSAF